MFSVYWVVQVVFLLVWLKGVSICWILVINYISATKCNLLKKCSFLKDHPNSTGSGISWKFYQPNQPKMVNTDRTWLLSSTKQDTAFKNHMMCLQFMLYPSSVLSERQLKSQLYCTIISPEFSRLHGFQLRTSYCRLFAHLVATWSSCYHTWTTRKAVFVKFAVMLCWEVTKS